MKILPLHESAEGFPIADALVDDDCFEKAKHYVWVMKDRKIYAYINGKTQTLLSFIFDTKSGRQIRRKDSSQLDFRRSNLRFPPEVLPPLSADIGNQRCNENEDFITMLFPISSSAAWKVSYDKKFHFLLKKYSWGISYRKTKRNLYCYVVRTLRRKQKTYTVNFARVVLGLQYVETGETVQGTEKYVATYKNPPDFRTLSLDLRASNLLCTTRTTVSHRRQTLSHKKSTSYVGVYNHGKKWRAVVTQKELGPITVGVYSSDEEAALARDRYIKENGVQQYFHLNFPE
jgi:hypothetical protein